LLLTEGGAPDNDNYDDAWRVVPPFGPFPRELSDSYPFTATVPDRPDRAGQVAAADGVKTLVEANPDTAFTLAVDNWHADALGRVPDRVTVESLAAIHETDGGD
jgi:7-cyano-7-deazaguanine tRNA-ribosyltransferase